MNPRTMTHSGMIGKVDRIFSRYIRELNAKYGLCRCYTCGTSQSIALTDCGHFMSRYHMATRFDENQCRPQCVECNRYKNGNLKVFEIRLKAELGEQTVENIRIKAKSVCKFTREDLEAIYTNYSEKLKTLSTLRNFA